MDLDSTSFTIMLLYFRDNSWRSSCFAILMMTFVITSKVIGLLWPDRSSWLHGNSTLRRCLLCSIQKVFFAASASSSASWHASFSTDSSPGCHVAFAGLEDIYIYICRPKIYFSGEQTSQPHFWSGELHIWMPV